MIRIRKGLNLPIAGTPEGSIEAAPPVQRVALLGSDQAGMKPTMLVRVGDRVKLGQPLFTDKKTPGVQYTSPAAGTVVEIHRGAKRRFESIEIDVDGDDCVEFPTHDAGSLVQLERDVVRDNLVASGMWTSLRTRPFSKVPQLDAVPHSIFVTAIDTRPLAPDPAPILKEREADFICGLKVLGRLTDGDVHVCVAPGSGLSVGDAPRVKLEEFGGPHPAGLPGTHIHFLDPVNENKSVWHVGYQDVAEIGRLFTTGKLFPERVISFAGPVVDRPRIVRARRGASVKDLAAGGVGTDCTRLISGSVLDGHIAAGHTGYLGRYHNQISAISDVVERPFLGWLAPGAKMFSATPAFASAIAGIGRKFRLTTATNGDHRPIIPIGIYEKVMPLDFEPTALLKAVIIRDVETAQALGALELDEEDLALCSFVCPGKSSFGPALRDVLTAIEREG